VTVKEDEKGGNKPTDSRRGEAFGKGNGVTKEGGINKKRALHRLKGGEVSTVGKRTRGLRAGRGSK